MTKRERVMATLAGAETDRPPFSFWYHFPGGERADEAFVRNEVEFARSFGVDILKVMHDAPFDLPAGVSALDSPEAFAELPLIEPTKGHFGAHLEALAEIKRRLPDDAPMVDTVFDPFAYGDKIVGKRLLEFLESAPEEAAAGLRSVTESLVRWVDACREGVDGIFLAAGAASEAMMTAERYEAAILPLDIQVMEAAMARGSVNVLHVHGAGRLHFDLLARCPAHIVNWSDRTTDVSLERARASYPVRVLAGGVNEVTAADVPASEIVAQIEDAIAQGGPRRFVVACGCAVPSSTPLPNLRAIAETVGRTV